MEKTLGEQRVRTDFDVGGQTFVDQIKAKSASLINDIDCMASKPEWNDKQVGEFVRLKSLAMTAYEEAAMWAAKAVTL